jgi:peptidylprolyl isomerase
MKLNQTGYTLLLIKGFLNPLLRGFSMSRKFEFSQQTKLLAFLLLTPFVLALTSCTTNGGLASKANSMSNVQSNSALPTVSANAGHEPTISMPSGNAPENLVAHDVIVGTGITATINSTLTVHYVLMSWSTGKVVQSSWTTGSPATFALSQVIPGWQKGIPGMRVGGRRLLIIPPSLAYGAKGAGPIGPNETLIFVVDLIKIA